MVPAVLHRSTAPTMHLASAPAATGHQRDSGEERLSIAGGPVDDVGQGPSVEIGAQIVAEEVDAPMLTHVTAARDMWGDEDAFVVPEATIGFMFEFPHVDVEGHAPQPSRGEGGDQRLLVDDLAARDIYQNGARLHGGQRLRTDQLGRLRCPLTADHHAIALLEEGVETLGAFQ